MMPESDGNIQVPKPIAGQAITFQSLLQYILMALVGLLSYFQYESSKSTAWARAEVVAAREEAKEERRDTWKEVAALRENMAQALLEIRGTRQATLATQKTAEATKKAVDKLE